MDKLKDSYDYVVIDCEAGMEHISRQTTREVDDLIIVSDPTLRSLNAAADINELIGQLRSKATDIALVINRIQKDLPQKAWDIVDKIKSVATITISEDDEIYDLDIEGLPLTGLSNASALKTGVKELTKGLDL